METSLPGADTGGEEREGGKRVMGVVRRAGKDIKHGFGEARSCNPEPSSGRVNLVNWGDFLLERMWHTDLQPEGNSGLYELEPLWPEPYLLGVLGPL